MSRPSAAILALATAFAAGCERPPDLVVNGAEVYVETDAPFAHEETFPARLETTLDAALRYWGGTWRALQGRSITLSGERHVACGGHAGALGCFDGDIRITTSDPGAGTFDCVEQTVLVHEVGHAVVGDAGHEDPRWMDFRLLEAALSGRKGFSPQGEVDCIIHASVWRHPRDAR